MKKFLSVILVICICLGLTACTGVKIDENEEIIGNGTWQVTKGGAVYTIENNYIAKDGLIICTIDNIKTYSLFALGEYLYVNTTDGAKQLTLDGKNLKKFGSGEIIAAGGRWIYYQSADNKTENMIVYKIDMIDGTQLQLFQDTILEVEKLDADVFYFKGESGNEYVNELNDKNGYFYSEWLENETE